MARPKKEETDKRPPPLSFRLTKDDYAAYLAKVKASGMSKSKFFRDCVLNNRTHVIARKQSSTEKGQLLYLFNKASNNINQLAYRANSDHVAGRISERTYAAILAELEELSHLMKATLKNVD